MLNLNGTYTLSCSGLQNGMRLVVTQLNVWQTVGAMNGNENPATFTTNLDDLIVYVAVMNGTTVNNVTIRPMLEVGNRATAYEPYKGQDYEINLGKNLFDKDNANVLDGYISNSAIVATNNDYTIWIPCEPSTTYTIQKMNASPQATTRFRVATTEDEPILGRGIIPSTFWNPGDGSTTNVHTITTASNSHYLAINIMQKSATTTLAEMLASIQIERGSIASSYSAYFAPIELCKIGTRQDRIYKENGKWYLHKEVGHYDITGAEDWTRSGRTTSTVFAGVLANDALTTHVQIGANECFSNRFIYKGANVEAGGYDVYNYSSAGVVRAFVLYVSADSASDITAFKTWLANNPTTVYYSLATPTDTEITNAEVLAGLNSAAGLKLFPGQNNITDQTPNAQPTMTVQYYTALDPGGGLVWESGEAGGATIIEASGLDSAFPLWTVPGPSTNPTLTNITTGQSITWQGTVPAGQTLEIDMDKQTATLAGANVYAFVSGDWIRIDPGSNRMTYVGTGATQASTLSWNNIVG